MGRLAEPRGCAAPHAGYNEQLRLSDALLNQVQYNVPQDALLELSHAALEFLAHQFALHDQAGDGLLGWDALQVSRGHAPTD